MGMDKSGKIITYIILPIVVTVFILVTVTRDQLSAVIFGVGVVLLLVIEAIRLVVAKAKVNSTTFRDATASFSIGLLTGFVNQLILLPVMYVFMAFVAAVTPLQLGVRIDSLFGSWTIPVSLAICLVLADFLYYLAHRSAHRVEVLWGSHSVHHSSEHFNPTTATRISFLDQAWDLVLMSVICLLGFNPLYALGAYAIVLLYQLPLHQTWSRQMPRWFELVFNTPVHHRAHHAYQRMYIDKNFGGISIIWDRMFGSFAEIDESTPPEFGLTVPVGTYNPFKLMVVEFGHMGRSMKEMPTVGDSLQVPFRPPYWKPAAD
jgi:sterol desaturase/sphingolipid hydroxylase (fatty acid hydroxylase superfamily)